MKNGETISIDNARYYMDDNGKILDVCKHPPKQQRPRRTKPIADTRPKPKERSYMPVPADDLRVMGREEIFELGRRAPYHRFVNFPVEASGCCVVRPIAPDDEYFDVVSTGYPIR